MRGAARVARPARSGESHPRRQPHRPCGPAPHSAGDTCGGRSREQRRILDTHRKPIRTTGYSCGLGCTLRRVRGCHRCGNRATAFWPFPSSDDPRLRRGCGGNHNVSAQRDTRCSRAIAVSRSQAHPRAPGAARRTQGRRRPSRRESPVPARSCYPRPATTCASRPGFPGRGDTRTRRHAHAALTSYSFERSSGLGCVGYGRAAGPQKVQ